MSTGSLFSRNSSNQYKWGTLGKSVADILQGGTGGGPIASRLSTSTPSGTSMAQTQAAGNLQKMFATIGASTESGMTYSDWVGTSRQFGIADFNAALEGAGYTQNQVQAMFQSSAMGQGIENKARREEQEETFWTTVQEHTQQLVDTTAAMLTELTEVTNATWLTQIHETNLELIDLTKIGNEQLVNIFMANDKFFKTWVDFNITQYQKAYDATKVANIKIGKEKAKSDDAVLALAEALTKNNVDLLNPAVQTNVLLSEIVKILAMIAQQNNGGGVTLSNSLIGLATGQTQNKKN